jgi:DNA-binding XRE family transcriptional regulator
MYSREELLQWLRELGDGDTPPTRKDLADHPESPSGQTYRNRFESFAQALLDAGFPAESVNQPTKAENQRLYSDEELLSELRRLADDLARTPRLADISNKSSVSTSTINRRFGSFNNALRAAGLDITKPHDQGPEYSREELLEQIRAITAERASPPSPADMNAADETPAVATYQRRFGSWGRAKRLAIRGDRNTDGDSDEDGDDIGAAEPRDPANVPVGSDLAAAREELGLSQADLADAVGVSPSAVAHWETRGVTPSPENAGRLHEVLQRLGYWEKS